jgi:ABC-2 type transport system permease protein
VVCAVLTGLFCYFRVWVVGLVDAGRFRQLIDLLPEDWERFSPVDFDWVVSFVGRTSMTLDEPLLVLLVCGWAIVRGADSVAGELGRGTMELLLAQPLARHQVFFHQFLVQLLGLAVLCLTAWLAMTLAVWLTEVKESLPPGFRVPVLGTRIPLPLGESELLQRPMHEVVDPRLFVPGVVNLFCFGTFFSGLASCISAMDRYGWRACGLGAVVWFLFALLKVASMASPALAWTGWFTVFSLYDPAVHIQLVETDPDAWLQWAAEHPGRQTPICSPLQANFWLLAGAALFALTGLAVLESRDLPAP